MSFLGEYPSPRQVVPQVSYPPPPPPEPGLGTPGQVRTGEGTSQVRLGYPPARLYPPPPARSGWDCPPPPGQNSRASICYVVVSMALAGTFFYGPVYTHIHTGYREFWILAEMLAPRLFCSDVMSQYVNIKRVTVFNTYDAEVFCAKKLQFVLTCQNHSDDDAGYIKDKSQQQLNNQTTEPTYVLQIIGNNL